MGEIIDISNIKQSSLDSHMLITKLEQIKKNSHHKFPLNIFFGGKS